MQTAVNGLVALHAIDQDSVPVLFLPKRAARQRFHNALL